MILYSERNVGEDTSFGRIVEHDYREVHVCENGLELGYCSGKFDSWKVSSSKNGYLVKNLEYDAEWQIPILKLFDLNCKAYFSKHTDESFIQWFLYKFIKETMPTVVYNVKNCYDPSVGSKDIDTLNAFNRAVVLVKEYEIKHSDEIQYVDFPVEYDFESVMICLWLMMLAEQNKSISVGSSDGQYYKIAPILGCNLKILAFFRGIFNLKAVLENDEFKSTFDKRGRKEAPLFEVIDSYGRIYMDMITARFISNESKKSSWTKRDSYGNLPFDYSSDLFNLHDWNSYQEAGKSFHEFVWDKFRDYLMSENNSNSLKWFNLDSKDIINFVLLPLRRDDNSKDEVNRYTKEESIEYVKNKISKMITPEMFGF